MKECALIHGEKQRNVVFHKDEYRSRGVHLIIKKRKMNEWVVFTLMLVGERSQAQGTTKGYVH